MRSSGKPGLLPDPKLVAGRAQDPLPDGQDEPTLLGHRDELIGHQQAALGMLPAQQGLGADHLARARVHHGLVVQHQLLAFDGAAQASLQGHALEGPVVHARGAELIVVPTLLLGPVHGGIGALQEGVRVRAVDRVDRDSHAGRDVQVVAVQGQRLGHGVEDLLREARRVLGLRHSAADEGELVAPHAGHGVVFAHAGDQALRERLEQPIAHGVSQRVVDELEMVDVHEHHGQQALLPVGVAEGLGQPVAEEKTVGQAGERVVVRLVPDALFRAPALGDVPKAPDPTHGTALQAMGRRVTVEDSPVRELEGVEGLGLGLGVELADPGQEGLGVAELAHGVSEHGLVPSVGEERGRDPPELGEALVVRHHPALVIDHQDAVGGRLQDRLQDRDGVLAEPGGFLEGGFDLTAVGHVADDGEQAGPAFELDSLGGDLDLAHPARPRAEARRQVTERSVLREARRHARPILGVEEDPDLGGHPAEHLVPPPLHELEEAVVDVQDASLLQGRDGHGDGRGAEGAGEALLGGDDPPQEPGVVDRGRGLGREGQEEVEIVAGEGPGPIGVERQDPEQALGLDEGHRERAAHRLDLRHVALVLQAGLLPGVRDEHRLARARRQRGEAARHGEAAVRDPRIAVAAGHAHLQGRRALVPQEDRALLRVDGGGGRGQHLAQQGGQVEGALEPASGLVQRGLDAQAFVGRASVGPRVRLFPHCRRQAIPGFVRGQ